jgi:hypothetical protein
LIQHQSTKIQIFAKLEEVLVVSLVFCDIFNFYFSK